MPGQAPINPSEPDNEAISRFEPRIKHVHDTNLGVHYFWTEENGTVDPQIRNLTVIPDSQLTGGTTA